MREIRYWNSRAFRRIYGRDPAAKGFPKQDAEGFYLAMGYRIRLDDGLPEDGEPCREPSAPAAGRRSAARRVLPPRGDEGGGAEGRRVSFRNFGYAGGFDGYEGRMIRKPETA